MAEVYWDLEWELQQQGFDWTYDKRLYDVLRARDVGGVRSHLSAGVDFQSRSVRFLENHDEPRAATVFPSLDEHRAAAAVTYLSPGVRFFHDGQFEGRRVRVPVHLCRRRDEPVDEAVAALYSVLPDVVRSLPPDGTWSLLRSESAWWGNGSHEAVVAFCWDRSLLVCVNLAPHWSQCYVGLPDGWPASYRLVDRLGPDRYDRGGDRLYLDVPPWKAHAFTVEPGG
jgi:hypothetical protein